MKLAILLQKLRKAFVNYINRSGSSEHQSLMLGKLLSETVKQKTKTKIHSLAEVEFKVFSQWGDDGIIQWLINSLDFPAQTFIEFGVENYRESNTRFLLMNDNWSGFVMDSSPANVAQIVHSEYFCNHCLYARTSFIDIENINHLLAASNLGGEIGILSIDLDGMDYWIWRAIETVNPIVVIIEYNSVFGLERAITVPYEKTFQRTKAHFSNLYFGASLWALNSLAEEKGYSLIGCTSSGNNAYFVRNDRLSPTVPKVSVEKAYVLSKFRESRDPQGRLTFLAGGDRLKAISGLPVFNTILQRIEPL